jgi:hypothetical protein
VCGASIAEEEAAQEGQVKVKVSVTYTPKGKIAGDPNTLSRHVKLLKKTS